MSEENELELVLEQIEEVVNRKIPLLVLAPEYTKILLNYIKQLKEKYLNAVADYETTKSEKQQLKQVLDEIKILSVKYNLGKYDYSIPMFEIEEILDKVGNDE